MSPTPAASRSTWSADKAPPRSTNSGRRKPNRNGNGANTSGRSRSPAPSSLAKQKRLPLTLSEVEGRELPTLAGAHQTLVDLGCEVTTNNGTLRLAVPERLRENDAEDLSARQAIHAASKLLDYARDVVVAHLQANQELPSGPITIGGGAVR